MAAFGQPDTDYWRFKIDKVEIIEMDVTAPLVQDPTNVINVPNTFKIRTTIRNENFLSKFLHQVGSGKIEYHAENLETDWMSHLTPTEGWTVPGDKSNEEGPFEVESAVFTTSHDGPISTTDLREGTYMLTVIVSFGDSPYKQTVTAFNQAYFRIFPE
jgi:hypothetical protein